MTVRVSLAAPPSVMVTVPVVDWLVPLPLHPEQRLATVMGPE